MPECVFLGLLGLAYLLGKTRGWVVQPLAGVACLTILGIWWLPPGWSQVLVVLGQS